MPPLLVSEAWCEFPRGARGRKAIDAVCASARRYLAPLILVLGSAPAAAPAQEVPVPDDPPVQASPSAPSAQAGAPGEANAATKKVIEDEAEYKAYVAAVNTQDPREQAEAMEAFIRKYPKSVVAAEAMERAMWDWQSVGDAIKVLEVAKELLGVDSGNVRALAVVVALDRISAAQGDSAALDEICRYSTAGMREVSMWQKPAGMTDADFALLNKQMGGIFNSAAGYCALEQRNFLQARDWFTRAIEADATDLQDMYDLVISDLELTPIDVNGFWYCAKAIQLAKSSPNAGAAGGMEAYCKPKYETYHGAVQGWDAILSAGATQNALPAGFAGGIEPAPAPPAAVKQK